MRKLCNLILALIFIFTMISSVCFSASSLTVTADSTDDLLNVLEYELLEDGTVKITRYDSLNSECNIPSEIDGYKVTVIGSKAFSNCQALRTVTVPDTVTIIEDKAFDSCKKLNKVTLGNSVKSIGYKAFGDCKALHTINFPSGLTTIGNNAFIRCQALKSVDIPETVTSIGNHAFSDCIAIDSLKIGNGENLTIGEFAFGWCLKVTEVTLGDKVKEIKDGAFCACDSLKKLIIENPDCLIFDSVNTIPDNTVLCSYSGSTLESYAKKYGITFEALDGTEPYYALGDVDADGEITIMDASFIQRALALYFELTDEQTKRADTDKDKDITIMDVSCIQKYVAKVIEEF